MIQWAERAVVSAIWTRTAESPAWIAGRLDDFARAVGQDLAISSWDAGGMQWSGDAASLEQIVVANPDTSATGERRTDDGYLVSLSGENDRVFSSITASAGDAVLGTRRPLHHLHATIQARDVSVIDTQLGNSLVTHAVLAFDPIAAYLTTSHVNLVARRGGWKIPPAYRLWLHDTVGPITTVAEGVTTTRLSNGTLLSVPDDWEPQQVVDATLRTLELNGLDELPH